MKITYPIGNPAKDGIYLHYGFLLPNAATRDEQEPVKENFRWAEKVAAIKVPAKGKCYSLTFKISAPIDQKVSIYLLGIKKVKLGTVSVSSKDKWQTFTVDINKTLESENLIQLVAEKEVLGYWRQNCYRLSTVTFKFERKVKPLLNITPWRKKKTEKHQLLFGDPHVHTNASLCHRINDFGTLEANIEVAKKNKLDYISFTDHPEHFTHFPQVWKKYRKIWKEHIKKPFVVLPGYEWSSKSYGNWNIYFNKIPKSSAAPHTWEQCGNSLPKIIKCCESSGCDFLIGTHHTFTPIISAATSYPLPGKYQNYVEIYSSWGQSETYDNPAWQNKNQKKHSPGFYAEDMLRRDQKLGFIGGSDCHYDFPGSAAVTGTYVKKFSTQGIFEAIQNRRTYATTVVGLKLNVSCNGYPMGHIFEVDQYTVNIVYPLQFCIDVTGTKAIESVELICNGYVIKKQTFKGNNKSQQLEWEFPRCSTELTDTNRYYYIRVKQKAVSPKRPGIAACSPFYINYNFRENPIGPKGEQVFIDMQEHALAPIAEAPPPEKRKRRKLLDI